MAFSGLHVAAGYAGAASNRWASVAIIGRTVWSQTMASAGVTTNVAPPTRDVEGDPIFQVSTSIDAFVAIGPNPDATNGPRQFIKANSDGLGGMSLYANPGDKLAWVPA